MNRAAKCSMWSIFSCKGSLTIVAIAVTFACSAASAHGVTCRVTSTTTRSGVTTATPAETLKYVFLPNGKFIDPTTWIGPMTISRTTITLGKEFWSNGDGSRYGAITIDRTTGAYRQESNGPNWSTAQTGVCRHD
jgi:hypothetical protein